MRREPREGSFSDYFTLGGQVRQPATPEFPATSDVLAYLLDCNFTVYPAPLGEGEPKYVYQGQVVTLDRLIAIANDHRALQAAPSIRIPSLSKRRRSSEPVEDRGRRDHALLFCATRKDGTALPLICSDS